MNDQPLAIPAPKLDPAGQVVQWIISGANEHEIKQAIEKHWPRTKARPLIVEAMKEIAASADADPANVRGWCIRATQFIYQQALAANDFPTALRAVKQLNDIAGHE